MSNYNACLEMLLSEAEKTGYLTFDYMMNAADTFDLSLSDVDRISEAVQLHDVIVYENEPNEDLDEDLEDYSRVDYDSIFNEVIELSQELKYVVELIRELPTPQYKEISLLTIQSANGNEYARERLILLHLRVVLKIALSMTKQYDLDITDSVSTGFVGLVTAVDKYDPNGFSAFQSYASMWIQQHIQRECNPTWFEYYFPAHYKNTMLTIKNKFEFIYGSIDDGMSNEDMIEFSRKYADELQEEPKKVYLCLKRIKTQKWGHVYLDELLDSEDESYLPLLISNEPTPEEYTIKKMIREEIFKTLQSLTEREEKVISLRFGLLDDKERTLEEVGKDFNVTRERIRQIEAKALRKLRNPTRAKTLRDYI
ncbi:sigma-70 family RNA polymerase sigma factor [[Clostridium] innocuum]|nr:sigma-70 family RNA polymerase sigma factor [[Clostridium] innocuum]MCR0560287.1 sigma-70 family RNA polymerase sigma factor [[Clostridium] innocuum]